MYEFGWVMAHIWMSHGTYMSESWHIYEWIMARIWMSHGICMNVRTSNLERPRDWSKDTCAIQIKNVRRYHGIHMDESWLTVVNIRMSHGAYVNESWHIYKWVMTRAYQYSRTPERFRQVRHLKKKCMLISWHIWMSHDTYMDESWLVRTSNLERRRDWYRGYAP